MERTASLEPNRRVCVCVHHPWISRIKKIGLVFIEGRYFLLYIDSCCWYISTFYKNYRFLHISMDIIFASRACCCWFPRKIQKYLKPSSGVRSLSPNKTHPKTGAEIGRQTNGGSIGHVAPKGSDRINGDRINGLFHLQKKMGYSLGWNNPLILTIDPNKPNGTSLAQGKMRSSNNGWFLRGLTSLIVSGKGTSNRSCEQVLILFDGSEIRRSPPGM